MEFFTVFLYGYLLYFLLRIKYYGNKDRFLIIAWYLYYFLFESFCLSAFFVTPLFPVVFAYLLKTKNEKKFDVLFLDFDKVYESIYPRKLLCNN